MQCTMADIAGISVFADLSQEGLSAICPRLNRRALHKNATLIDAGGDDHFVFFVLSGSFRVSLVSEHGREVMFREIGPGETIGEVSALDGGRRSATVIALSDSSVAYLPGHEFTKLLADFPPVALSLMRQLTHNQRQLTQRLFEQSALVTTERLKVELIRRAKPINGEDGPHIIAPLPSQSELAAWVGSHREAVNRILTRLAQMGLIEKQSDRLIIPDVDALSHSS